MGGDVVLHDVDGVCDSRGGLGEGILTCDHEEETRGAGDITLTHCPLSLLSGGHVEDVSLVPGVWFIVRLNVDGELLYKGTGVPKKPWKPDYSQIIRQLLKGQGQGQGQTGTLVFTEASGAVWRCDVSWVCSCLIH